MRRPKCTRGADVPGYDTLALMEFARETNKPKMAARH